MIRIDPAAIPVQTPWQIGADGWCAQASHLVSPNFNARPDPDDISLLVIHNISLPQGQFGGPQIAALFQNCLACDSHPSFASLRDLQVSAHFLIRRDGTLLQFVSTLERAWHAGLSNFQGRSGCNDFSIGIELEGCDELPFEPAQYQTLIQLTRALLARFAITHIAGHAEIAPGRKTDPGPHFDWLRYRDGLFGVGSG